MQENDLKNQDVVLESASALMDGEASELDLRRVLKAAGDAAVAERWRRYHVVRASLQQEMHSRPGVNLLAGIHERMSEEAHPVPVPRVGTLLRRLGQGAVAASVAFTALFAVSQLQQADTGQTQQPAIALQADQMPSLGGDFTPSELSRTVSMDAAARKRLQQAVYQSSVMQPQPFGEPYIFPEHESVAVPVLELQPAALR